MVVLIEDDLTRLLESANQPAEEAARELIVIELYRQHRISSGKAAELLRTPRVDFLKRASELGIPYIDLSAEDLEQEIAEAGALTVEHDL
jgi:predicted HTH domain antitoxin